MIAVCRKCRGLVTWPEGAKLGDPVPRGARLWQFKCPCGGKLRGYRPNERRRVLAAQAAAADAPEVVLNGRAIAADPSGRRPVPPPIDYANVRRGVAKQPRLPGL